MRLTATLRLQLLLALVFTAVGLTLLYATGTVIPGVVSTSLWIAIGAVTWISFGAHKIPLISLSRATVGLYLYASIALFWPILYPQITIAVRSISFQTPEIFAKANHLVAIGLAAMVAGWLLAFELRMRLKPAIHAHEYAPIRAAGFVPSMLIALPLLVLAFPTESILTVGYTGAPRETTVGAAVEINVIKPALFICLLLALLAMVQRPTPFRKFFWGLFIATSILVLGFASGNRVEELGCLLAVAWVFQNRQPKRHFPKRGVAIAVVLAVAMLVLAEIRSALPAQSLDSAFLADAVTRALQLIPPSDTVRMKPTTNGDIASTLCVVIGLVDTSVLQIDYGETFAKYATMTLPRFLNPNRPTELQVFLLQLGMTGGGLFILAEPYLAGGAVGVLLIMTSFGFLIGSLEVRYMRKELSSYSFFLYFLLLSCSPRWFFYSILSMYKHVLTGVIIIIVVRAVTHLTSKRSELYVPRFSHS